MMEALHTLGAHGRRALAELGYERPLRLERCPPANRRHFLGVNDIRVAVLRNAARDGVRLNFFFASWELQERNWPYVMVPDAVAEVECAGTAVAALFEYDRATEGLAYVVERKLTRYAEGLDGFAFSRVITVVDHARRREELQRRTAEKLGDPRFCFLLRDALADWSVRELLAAEGSGERSGVRTVLRP